MFVVSIGRKYIQRIVALRAVGTFTELAGLRASRLHQFTENRAGQYVSNLTSNFRLIIGHISEDSIRIISVGDYLGA